MGASFKTWQNRLPGPEIAPDLLESRWYAAYTCANHEKRVREQFEQRSVESLLPLYEALHRWKDRRVQLELPLFPGYVFVRISLSDRLCVLQVPGVVRLVGFSGLPCALPEDEIQAIRECMKRGYPVKPHPYLESGRQVRVKTGPLQGLVGIIQRRKNRTRFVLSLQLIQRSMSVECDGMDLEPVETL